MERHRGQFDDADIQAMFASLRPDGTPPAGARERLERQLREAMACQEITSEYKPHGGFGRRWALRGAVAVATVAAVALVFWWLVGGGVSTASAGFVEVLQQVRQATTAAYRLVLRVSGQPDDGAEVLMAAGGNAKVTWDDGRTVIYRSGESRWLTYNPSSGRAYLHRPLAVSLFDEPLEALRRATESDGELVGEEMLAGRTVAVYRVRQAKGAMRIWVDPRDNLPVRIEATSSAGGGAITMILEDLRWNLPIAESVFRLEIPPGYTLVRPEAEASEEAMVEALRGCAERSDGRFPAAFDRNTVSELLLRGVPQTETTNQEERILIMPEWDAASKEFARLCARGLAFVEQVNADGSWRYAGGGVRLGDRSKVLCWWRSPGKNTFRVVYGDLTVRDVSPSQMPHDFVGEPGN